MLQQEYLTFILMLKIKIIQIYKMVFELLVFRIIAVNIYLTYI